VIDYSSFYKIFFDRIYITNDACDYSAAQRSLKRLNRIPVFRVKAKEDIPREHLNQRTLLITLPRGERLGYCPGSRGHLCCNYLTVDLYVGCPLGCTYCIMKSYLNFSPITVYPYASSSIERIREISFSNPGRMVRIGTGEVGDSLFLDPVFELSEEFIRGLADCENVFFELKTKTHFVDHLLGIHKKGNAVIGFSLSPDKIAEREEGDASSLKNRLEAAAKAVENGFLVSFHFDPVFLTDDFKGCYSTLVDELKLIPEERIAWISLGTFRYTAQLKDKIGCRDYLFEEFVLCKDGKYRYLQRIRAEVYRFLVEKIRTFCSAPVYMCMESAAVWKKVFGALPSEVSGLEGVFHKVTL